jgi:hypothetical protein
MQSLIDGDHLVENCAPGAALGKAARLQSHRAAHLRVLGQGIDRPRELLVRSGHEAVRLVTHQLLGSQAVRDDDGQAGCHGLEDDVAESVRAGRKDEEVGISIGARERLAFKSSAETRVR